MPARRNVTVVKLGGSFAFAPQLKDWLDAHLPEVVEDLVTREIARITGRDL